MTDRCECCQRPAKGLWLLLEPEGWTYEVNGVSQDAPSPSPYCSRACARATAKRWCQEGYSVVQIDDS